MEAADRLKQIQLLWMEKCKWEIVSLAKAKKDWEIHQKLIDMGDKAMQWKQNQEVLCYFVIVMGEIALQQEPPDEDGVAKPFLLNDRMRMLILEGDRTWDIDALFQPSNTFVEDGPVLDGYTFHTLDEFKAHDNFLKLSEIYHENKENSESKEFQDYINNKNKENNPEFCKFISNNLDISIKLLEKPSSV